MDIQRTAVGSRSVPPVNKRLCRIGAVLAGVTVIFLTAGNAAMWLVPEWTESAAHDATYMWTQDLFITPFVQWVGLGITTLHLGVLVWGLMSMRTLFRMVAAGHVFVAETGVLLRRFGIALLVDAGLAPIVRSALAALVTFDPARHELALSFGVDGDDNRRII